MQMDYLTLTSSMQATKQSENDNINTFLSMISMMRSLFPLDRFISIFFLLLKRALICELSESFLQVFIDSGGGTVIRKLHAKELESPCREDAVWIFPRANLTL